MADYVRTAGDLAHRYLALLQDKDGPLDLRAADAVTFSGRLVGDALPSIGGAGSIIAPSVPADHPDRGVVAYDPLIIDAAVSGIYMVKWHATMDGSPDTQSFPEDGYMTLIILPRN